MRRKPEGFWTFWVLTLTAAFMMIYGCLARADDFTDRIAQLEAQNAATAEKPADPFAKGNAAKPETCDCGGPTTCDCPKGTCKCPNCTFPKSAAAVKASPCSSACTCGCNDGGDCGCSAALQAPTYYAPPRQTYYAPRPQQFFGGGGFANCGSRGG